VPGKLMIITELMKGDVESLLTDSNNIVYLFSSRLPYKPNCKNETRKRCCPRNPMASLL
jgi:hypothetical protein